jgi:PAS domain S-box-containing protein
MTIKILLFCANHTEIGIATAAACNLQSDAGLVQEMLLNIEKSNFRPIPQFHLIEVKDFFEVISILQTESIDVVILDLSFNKVDDLKIVSRVRSLAANVPIVVLAELAYEVWGLQAVSLGAQDYLIKSEATPQMLQRILLYAIERQRCQSQEAVAQDDLSILFDIEEQWRCLSEASFEGIIIHDAGIILNANHALAKMTGYEVEELIGKNSFELATPESQNLIRKNILSGYEKPYEAVVSKKDGSSLTVELESKIILYQGREMQVVAVRDITERQQTEKARQITENCLREQSQTLMQLAKSKILQQGNLNLAFKEITEAAARTLQVQRVSIWLYNEDHSKIQCIDLYDAIANCHNSGMELVKADYPGYFEALEAQGSVIAHDALNSSIIQELSQSYLRVFGITSLLDAAIWLGGRLVGVVCYEQLSGVRQWTLAEENFASSIADFVALAMEAKERNAAQEILQQSEAQFRAIFERSSIGIGLADIRGRIVDINPALCQMLGYSREEVYGKHFTDYLALGEATTDFKLYQQMLTGIRADPQRLVERHRLEMEKRFLDKKGRLVWTHLSVSLITSATYETALARETLPQATAFSQGVTESCPKEEPQFFLAMIEDITERKQTEMKLRASTEAAEAGSRAKSEFLATMSHELRTPLNAIMGLSQLLQQEMVGSLNDKQKEYINCIYSSGEHLLALINDILDLSKVEAGKEEITLLPISVQELCNYAISTIRDRAVEKGLQLITEIDPEVEICIADERRIKQMLLNLLSNAVKFTSDGQVWLKVKKVPQGINFIVEDTGIGIDPNQFQFLFEPFKQLDSRLNRKYEGTGLGLALTRKLARLHGGEVTVESTLGEGTQFTLFLPDQTQQNADEHSEFQGVSSDLNFGNRVGTSDDEQLISSGSGESVLPKAKRILLVEDEENTAILLQDYLQTIGYQVERTGDGNGFLERVRSQQPDLILLDVQLAGDLTGWDLLNILRQQPDLQNLPIVMMTPMGMVGDRPSISQIAANDYLRKPIGIVQLESILMRYLN